MRILFWSWNYEPEPLGIGPVVTVVARALVERGHQVDVLAAHPHYPSGLWGSRRLPYREERDGVNVLRLPLWLGRESSFQRIREELSHAVVAGLIAPFGRAPDLLISVSPSFLALAPALAVTRLRRWPWLLWLQDILPDGAASTGLVANPQLLRLSRGLEQLAYRNADRIVVISRKFRENLLEKGVPAEKIDVVYNPATRGFAPPPLLPARARILHMGNMGWSQGLVEVVECLQQADDGLAGARLVLVGAGELEARVREAIRSDAIEARGLLSDEELAGELERTTLGLVSQRPDIVEFNIPSKLMTFMALGIPVLAVVPPASEVARIVTDARAGWVVSSAELGRVPNTIRQAVSDPVELRRRGVAARAFAEREFSPAGVAARIERASFEARA